MTSKTKRNGKRIRSGADVPDSLVAFIRRFSDDAECRRYLEKRRWPNGPVCPHCGNTEKVYVIKGKSARKGLYKCKKCRKQFTVTIGTVFEGSHIPLSKWFAAFFLMSSSKKGISAHQLHRSLDMTYKSAWFMCHRIREAMKSGDFKSILSGKVEVDETYIGGKNKPGKRGRGAAGKTIVFGMVEREGNIKAKVVPDVKRATLHPIIVNNVAPGSLICSDELKSYNGLPPFLYHASVNHSRKEYVTAGDIHVNTAESFWALLKRGVHGTFHHIGADKVDMYCGEFSFRFDRRRDDDADRFVDAVTNCDGRLRWFFKDQEEAQA